MGTKKLDVKALLSKPPKLHEDESGNLISNWRIDDQTVEELNRRLKPGMRTVETGAGLSTIIFAVNGCHHTCIAPEQSLVDRIRAYCDRTGVDYSQIEFRVAKSRDVVHQLTPGAYDLALIDGLHGFPTAYVDFCYLTLALRKQGVLIVDDMHIHTCRSIAEFMESDGSWQVEILTARFALGIKLDEVGGVDSGWGDPFVFNRSVGGNNAQGVFVDPSEWYKPAYEPELVPPANVMRGEGVDTLEEWFRWGEEWSMALKVYAGLTTKSRAFEIGCGLGRIAFPLRFQLLNGTYDGLDFYPHKIDFLRRRFQSRYPNFCFHHAESPRHNGSHSDLKFGFPDASFDTVYAASIFTSLKPDAAREYLREISRVLDPHGRAAIGVFILDHYDPRRARPLGFARPQFNFDHFPDRAHRDFAVSDPKTPAPLTAFTQNALLGFAAEAGLTLAEPCIPGLWSGSSEKFRLAEDLLIFRHSG